MIYNKNSSIILCPSEEDHREKSAIASRDFVAGDEILSENAVLFGPVPEPKFPLCLGCGITVDCSVKCIDCGWPVCELSCDKLERHKSNECEIFKKCCNMSFQRLTSKKTVFHQYDCILPLRLLLLIEKNPDQWKCLEDLNSFEDVRRDDVSWTKERVYVVKYIRQKCKYKKFDEEFIHKICGILNAHSFQLSNTKNSIRCMFNYSHLFSNSCVPNTTFVIIPSHDFRIYIRATMEIRKGEKLTYSKTKVIMPTLLRRQELIQNSYLSCCCLRCADVTELQSNFSTLKCPKCFDGFMLSENSLDFEADWRCNCCKLKKRYTHLKKLYNEVEKELNKIRDEPVSCNAIEKCERLLEKYEPIFHFNHSFIVYLKYYWLSLSLSGDTFQSCDAENIDRKIIRLYEILRVFDIISPGFTLLRGTTFHLLYKAYVVKAKQYDNENPEQFMKYMSKAMQFLDFTEQIMVVGKPFTDHSES